MFVFEKDSGWVGSTTFSFHLEQQLGITGRILYTLNGTKPATSKGGSTYRYEEGSEVTLDSTVTVRAIHYSPTMGLSSDEVRHTFKRAKLPTPKALYGGNPKFNPTLPCTLSVATQRTATAIRYTLNDSALAAKGILYSAPFTLGATTTLRAFASETGYDDSDPLKVAFTLEPVAAPAIDPPSKSFGTPTLTLRIKSSTLGSHIRYTTDPGLTQPEKWTLMTGDSVTFQGGKDGDSIQLRAQAFVTTYQTSPTVSAKYHYLPPVAAPSLSPGSKTFYDTLRVTLSSTTPGAYIRYTDDGISTPVQNSLNGDSTILLKRSATLRARAFKDKHDPSPVTVGEYAMLLSPPTADKTNQEFKDQLAVRLMQPNPDARIFYSMDGKTPVLEPNGSVSQGVPADSDGIITVGGAGTTIVKAIAVLGSVSSGVAEFAYTKKEEITTFAEPGIDPAGDRSFTDTLGIRLSTSEAGGEIRYTLTAAGRDPLPTDSLAVSGRPIRLDSSAVLRCRVYPRATASKSLQPSNIREARYTLMPSRPDAFPPPGAPIPAGSRVVLKTSTKGGIIHYVFVPGADAGPAKVDPAAVPGHKDSVTLILNTGGTVSALTRLGTGSAAQVSETISLHYEVFTPAPSDTLAAGGQLTLAGGLVFLNQSNGPVLAKVRTSEGLGLSGFEEISLVLSLSPLQAGQALRVGFARPPGRTSLYRLYEGRVEIVTGAAALTLTRPGGYFTAVDARPPLIELLQQIPNEGRSTTVRLRITDNVADPACEIKSPGIPNGAAACAPDADGLVVMNLKGEEPGPKPLWFRVVSRDAYDSSVLPPGGGKAFAAQIWPKLTTPEAYSIGKGPGQAVWDLIGLPVAPATSLRWGDVRSASPDLKASVLRDGEYVDLDDTAEILPGKAFWAASRNPRRTLELPRMRADGSQADGTYRVTLKQGWNMIASPSLDRVFWPITPKISNEGSTLIKAPHRFEWDAPDHYVQTDTLEPWIGYFAYSFYEGDTTITLYSERSARPAIALPARKGAASADISIALSAPGTPPLSLGTRPWAQDGFGPEDEPGLPARSLGGAWSQRGGRRLLSDMIPYRPGSAARWRVILHPEPEAGRAPRINGMDLPPGHEAWAYSRSRGVKFRLQAGSQLPMAPDSPDTLEIFAGTPQAVAALSEWSAPEGVAEFGFALERNRGQVLLRIDLPWNGRLAAEVATLAGRRVAQFRTGALLPGIYRERLFSGTPAQILVLRLRYSGPAGERVHTLKIVP